MTGVLTHEVKQAVSPKIGFRLLRWTIFTDPGPCLMVEDTSSYPAHSHRSWHIARHQMSRDGN